MCFYVDFTDKKWYHITRGDLNDQALPVHGGAFLLNFNA
jgi:hypothetical protein